MAAVYKSIAKSATNDGGETTGSKQKIRNKVLILSSRGVTFRQRHLINDLHALIPHSRKDAKLDTKTKLHQLNEIAELYNCNSIFFFEARKGEDLYAWMSKPPNGPTAKFYLQNLHTMAELHFTGNCLKGSRPILSFDANFDKQEHSKLIKELLLHTFSVPMGARKTKPFVDHVMAFTMADAKIWARCYQINESEDANMGNEPGKATGETCVSLVEIGPRFVMTPIVIQESSFGGPIIYQNKQFVSPNQIRRDLRRTKAARHNLRAEAQFDRNVKRGNLGLKNHGGRRKDVDPLDNKVLFA